MSKLTISNLQGQPVGEYEIADELLERRRGAQAVRDAVVAFQAAQRSGSASTLGKGEVAGTGAKPWRQKGTGRARAGYRRSPVWRGGGVVFGPRPRSFAKGLNRKTARLAFRRAFSERVAEGDVMVLDALAIETPKTKTLATLLKGLKLGRSALLVVDRVDPNLALAARNLASIELTTAASVNTYQVLRHPKVVVTRAALAEIEQRLRKTEKKA